MSTHDVRRARTRLQVGIAAAALFLAGLVLTGIGLLLVIAGENRATGRRLVDCTTPGGVCYARLGAGHDERSRVLREVVIAVEMCARSHETERGLRACVTAQLEDEEQ